MEKYPPIVICILVVEPNWLHSSVQWGSKFVITDERRMNEEEQNSRLKWKAGERPIIISAEERTHKN